MNDAQKTAEAVYVEEGKIIKVGNLSDMEQYKSDETDLIDLEGNTMLPGFIDPHGHITAIAQTFMIINLSEAESIDEVKDTLRKYMEDNKLDPEDWIIGFGYDNTKFDGEAHPTKFDLDSVTTKFPIFLSHASGHLAVTNSLALEKLGYTGDSYDVPEGGTVRTVEGTNEPNGILEENACLAPEKRSIIPSPSLETLINSLVKAQEFYASLGITTCQDASIDDGMQRLMIAASNSNSLFLDIVGFAVQ